MWVYDAELDAWVRLATAVVLPNANVLLVQTLRLGLFGLFQATDGSLSHVGNASDFPLLSATLGTGSSAATGGNWQSIATATLAPYVVAWDTTILADGAYELRAVCAEDSAALAAFQTVAVAGADSGSGSSNCFIATAVYGTAMAPQVQVLRAFRDTYLLPHTVGRWLVAQYYRLSPSLADFIRDRAGLRAAVRVGLSPLVWGVGLLMQGGSGAPLALLPLALLGGLGIGWGLWRRRT